MVLDKYYVPFRIHHHIHFILINYIITVSKMFLISLLTKLVMIYNSENCLITDNQKSSRKFLIIITLFGLKFKSIQRSAIPSLTSAKETLNSQLNRYKAIEH